MSEKETGQTFAEWAEDGRMMGGMERMFAEDAWNAATKQQADTIERLQAELAAVKEERDGWKNLDVEEAKTVDALIDTNLALALRVKELGEALGYAIEYWIGPKSSEPMRKALASTATAEEVLAAHDAKVIERCAAHVDCPVVDTGHGFAAALRALIAAPKENGNEK